MPTLSQILSTQLIPWSEKDAAARFIVARPKMRQADMPYGVKLIPHKIQSRRVVVKNRRQYNNVRNVIARWPEAGLHELGKYALICVLSGHVDYQVGNYKLRCGAGYFIFIPPGTPHPNGTRPYVDLEKSAACDIITFVLHPNALDCWMSHGFSQGRERSNNYLFLHSQAIGLFQMLVNEIHGKKNQDPHISQRLLTVFLHVMQREADADNFQDAGNFHRIPQSRRLSKPGITPSPHSFAAQLEEYVQLNIKERLTLESVSRDMYLSPAQFSRNVRRETGKSFNQYLAELRLAKVKHLLGHSEWTIKAVASMAGFQSTRYFCSFFKRHVGLTPSEYRTHSIKNEVSAEN